MTIRRIFFSTVFNAGRFVLLDNLAVDVFLQSIYPLLEEGTVYFVDFLLMLRLVRIA